MKEKKSFMEKHLPTFSSDGFITWIKNLFSWANILALIISVFSVWGYMIRTNFINLLFWLLWEDALRRDYRWIYELFENVYTSAWAFVACIIITSFIISQYINYKNKRLTTWHFIVMWIIFTLIVLPFFWHGWVIDYVRELLWFDYNCHH